MKKIIKVLVTSFLMAFAFTTAITSQDKLVQSNIQIYSGVDVYINNQLLNMRDANGEPIEAFIYNDSTYLPIRALADAFDKEVSWNGETSTVYINDSTYVPIIMYHHFDTVIANDMVVSPEKFDIHMAALKSAGYNAITFDMLIDYVENGTPLPKKPICITMDDGYLSNYEKAYPILQKYHMKATIFINGKTVGRPAQNEHGALPKITWEQAREMTESGLVSIHYHTYDMHQWAPFEDGTKPIRENMLPFEGESFDEYTKAIKNDVEIFNTMFAKELSYTSYICAYPGGKYNQTTEEILQSLGFKVTLTTDYRTNLIKIGDSSSLKLLGRFYVTDNMSGEDLLLKLENASKTK